MIRKTKRVYTRFQHVEILVLEAFGRGFVSGVQRVHQPVAERIGVDVERRMHKVRDIGPEGFIAVHEIKRVTQ